MSKKIKLAIELVPSSSWQNNLRNLLKPKMWERLRKDVYKNHKYKCFVCESERKLHAHEVWEYDDKKHIQKLVNIIALCSKCHAIKHIGFAGIQTSKKGESYETLVKHFMKMNNCDREIFEKHLAEAFKKFEERSHYDWQLDLKIIKKN